MTEPATTSAFGRLRAIQGRTKLLIGTGVLLAVVVFGFNGCSGVEVGEDEAAVTARAAFDRAEGSFVPEHTHVRMLRQGFPPAPVWAVVFTVNDPEGGRDDYLYHAAVTVDARTGEVVEVDIGAPSGG